MERKEKDQKLACDCVYNIGIEIKKHHPNVFAHHLSILCLSKCVFFFLVSVTNEIKRFHLSLSNTNKNSEPSISQNDLPFLLYLFNIILFLFKGLAIQFFC